MARVAVAARIAVVRIAVARRVAVRIAVVRRVAVRVAVAKVVVATETTEVRPRRAYPCGWDLLLVQGLTTAWHLLAGMHTVGSCPIGGYTQMLALRGRGRCAPGGALGLACAWEEVAAAVHLLCSLQVAPLCASSTCRTG